MSINLEESSRASIDSTVSGIWIHIEEMMSAAGDFSRSSDIKAVSTSVSSSTFGTGSGTLSAAGSEQIYAGGVSVTREKKDDSKLSEITGTSPERSPLSVMSKSAVVIIIIIAVGFILKIMPEKK